MQRFLTASALGLTLAALAGTAQAEEVNIYSHRQPELLAPLLDAFTAETGIKTNVAFIDKGLAERLTAEGDRSPADVVLTVDIARLMQIVEAGVTQPVQSDALEAAIPETLRDPADQWFGLTTRGRIAFGVIDLVAPGDITTYEDLADPKWEDRICIRSGLHDYNIALLSAYIAHHGVEEARAWAEGLKANLGRAPEGGDRDQIKAAVAGQCDVTIGNTYYYGEMLNNPEEAPIAQQVTPFFPIFEGGGTHVNVSGVAMTKSAPNKEAALKFMEWLVSDKAQAIYAETNHEYPVKAGVALSETVAAWGDLSPDTIGLAEVATHRAEALAIMEEIDFDH
jgi:iron(III) transport system substrate-binding protein